MRWLAVLVLIASCGGGGVGPDASPGATDGAGGETGDRDAPLADGPTRDVNAGGPGEAAAPLGPQDCRTAWRSLYVSEPYEAAPGPGDLAWRAGTLFVGHSSGGYSWVFSLPERGGAKNLLYEGHLQRFWLEDDRLLYTQSNDLFEIPQSGGPPKSALQLRQNMADSPFEWNLDRTAVYWMTASTGLTAWRTSRGGGTWTKLAAIPDGGPEVTTRLVGERLLVTRQGNAFPAMAVTVGKVDGAITNLPGYGPSARILGTSNAGTLLWGRTEQSGEDDGGARRYHLVLARADLGGGPPQPWATRLPETVAPLRAWPAGGGAWYVEAREGGPAQQNVLSVWYLRADGTASLLACQPTPSTYGGRPAPTDATITSALSGDGVLYATLAYPDGHWMLAAVNNPGASADPVDTGAGGPGVDGGAGGTPDAGCPAPMDGGRGTSGQVTEFELPTPHSGPVDIARGPDGALWFGEVQTRRLGRITTGGCITEFPVGGLPGSSVHDIVAGPNNYLWFGLSASSQVGRMLVDGSLYQEFKLAPGSSGISDLVMGPDGNLWFAQGGPSAIGRLTLTGEASAYKTPWMLAGPASLAVGSDGAIWFSETNYQRIGRIDPATMKITEFEVPSRAQPGALAAGPDGNLWFLSGTIGSPPKLVRLTTAGTFTEFPVALPAGLGVWRMISGPDGNLWLTAYQSNDIIRITLGDATVTRFPVPTPNAGLHGLTMGPDGNLWFTEAEANKIGRLVP